jgi:hypothetical protein
MRCELAIDYIGPSDEDRAHLRLLMRKLGGTLVSRWHWGEEHRADALFIDPATLAGQMARTRAQEGGVRGILLDEVAAAAPSETVLRRPFRADALRVVLDRVASLRIGDASAAPITAQPAVALVFEPQSLEADAGLLAPTGLVRSAATREPSHDDAESLFRRAPLGMCDSGPRALPSLSGASVEPWTAPTQRSMFRGAPEPASTMDAVPKPTARRPNSGSGVSLREFLDGDLLGGPSRIVREGLPSLSLDPKERVFHADAPLAALKPYLQMALRSADWRPLTSTQLRQLRELAPARDYLHLRWLDRLHAAGGQLPRHLDPGGSYLLTAPFEVAADFPAQQRIVRALARPIRLHELAATAAVRMVDVFDAVAALDGIGIIECRPRERLRRPNDPPPPAPGGFLARALASISRSRGMQ